MGLLLRRGQRAQHHQVAALHRRDGHPVKSVAQGDLHGVAGVLGQGVQKIFGAAALFQQQLAGLVGIDDLVAGKQKDRLGKRAKLAL